MTGRDVTRMAFELSEPPRVPVTVIGGGAWKVNMAGKTFAEIKEDPEKIAEVFIQAFTKVGHGRRKRMKLPAGFYQFRSLFRNPP